MLRWEQRYLGHDGFPQTLSDIEIIRFFTPSVEEKWVILSHRSQTHRIAFALQIGFLKMTGRSLNSVELIPPAILQYLGTVIGCPAPRIASIRSLYRRRRTLFDHQAEARHLLGRRELSDHGARGLTAHLRREAVCIYNAAELMQRARVWLVERNYLLPRERELRRLAVLAMRFQERVLFRMVCATTDKALRQSWPSRLLEPSPTEGACVLEWLQTPPANKAHKTLDGELAKLAMVRELGAGLLAVDAILPVGLEYFHRQVSQRRPSRLAQIREPRRSLELACFLRLQLIRLTDRTLDLIDRKIASLWQQARERATDSRQGRLRHFRVLLGDLVALAGDEGLSATALRERLLGLVAPFEPELENTQVLMIRQELSCQSRELDRLLRSARMVELEMSADHKLATAFRMLDQCGMDAQLPVLAPNPFGKSWQALIGQPDRAAAFRNYQAASAMLLKRALKNRSVTAKDGLSHKSAQTRLMPSALWHRDRARHLRTMSMPKSGERYLRRLEAALNAGLVRLAAAAEAGLIIIDDDGVHLPRRQPRLKEAALQQARKTMSASFGGPQLSDVLIEVDSYSRFSGVLLGRPAVSEHELVTLYAALLALGSGQTGAELHRMIPRLNVDSLGEMIHRLETHPRLRQANDEVIRFMRNHRIATLWGHGVNASADMMSLDATRYLWNARLDPRRKGPAVGTYPHILDQWSIFYDQPIVLGRRQAGAAIEGALRQTAVERIDRVAVDTHGFTHFGMALGKACGFDLCPRLARTRTRKLYLPKGFTGTVPEALKSVIASEQISRRTFVRGWDSFLHLAASVKDGWYPATDALDQYGSASQGAPVHATAVATGKLLRSIYLCDYFANADFRNAILDLLNQGEAVHSLQRALHNGAIGAKRGRSTEQIVAISGALTLLSNIVMAWNTHRMQQHIDINPDEFPDNIVARMAPINHAHINMRGIMAFDLNKAASDLIRHPKEPLAHTNYEKAE